MKIDKLINFFFSLSLITFVWRIFLISRFFFFLEGVIRKLREISLIWRLLKKNLYYESSAGVVQTYTLRRKDLSKAFAPKIRYSNTPKRPYTLFAFTIAETFSQNGLKIIDSEERRSF